MCAATRPDRCPSRFLSVAVPRVMNKLTVRLGGVVMVQPIRTAAVTVTCLMALMALTACSGDHPEPEPTSSPTPTASTSWVPTSSPSPTEPSVPAYLERFSEAEREAYADAVADFGDFSEGHGAILSVGEATPAAKAFYQERTAAWQTYWAQLRAYERQGIRVVGIGRVIETRPTVIELYRDGSGRVDLRVCGISEGVEVLQNGEPIPQPDPEPTITRVRLVLLSGESTWRVLSERLGSEC